MLMILNPDKIFCTLKSTTYTKLVEVDKYGFSFTEVSILLAYIFWGYIYLFAESIIMTAHDVPSLASNLVKTYC